MIAGLSKSVTPAIEKPVENHGPGVEMYFKIKKVYGKPYLYKCWWDAEIHDVVCRIVGNCYWLEEIANQWRAKNKKKRLQLKKTGNRWAGSSAGRAPPSHGGNSRLLLSEFYPRHVRFDDARLLDKFYNWLLDQVSEDTAKYYVNVIKKLGGWVKNSELKEKQRKAVRKWIHFLSNEGLIDYNTKLALLDHYKLQEKRRHQTKKWIPDDRVAEVLGKVDGAYKLLLKLKAYSGVRLSHIVYMLNNWKPDEIVQHMNGVYEPRLYCAETFCRYYVGIKEAGKRCDYIYFPRSLLREIEQTVPLGKPYRYFKDWYHHHDIEHGFLRSFFEQRAKQTAIENKIPEDAVKLLMSRELSISGTHYDDTRRRADQLYSILVKELEKVIPC